jgi:hypothetical protein
MRTNMLRRTQLALTASAVVLLAGCAESLNVTNPNAPSLGNAASGRAAVSLSAIGVLNQNRNNQLGWATTTGSYGREYLNLQPQFGNTVFGPYRDWNVIANAGLWAGPYANLRNISILNTLVDTIPANQLVAGEAAAMRGFNKTFEALELYFVIVARDSIGAVTQVLEDPLGIAPFVARDSVLRYVTNQLDAGLQDLTAATAFPFTWPTGFVNGVAVNTVAGFRQFNRALKARVEAYRASVGCGSTCYTAALTALTQSFYTGTAGLTTASLAQGVTVPFSLASGDAVNGLSSAQFSFVYANQAIRDDGSIPGVTTDLRYVAKVRTASPSAADGITSNLQPFVYATGSSPMPIIRREELVLLFAEASYFTGATGDALTAINAIRTVSGGLAARGAFASSADFTTELLNQRRLSLFFEGHRWVDVRRLRGYAGLPAIRWNEPSTFTVATRVRLPQGECNARRQSGDAALIGPGCP